MQNLFGTDGIRGLANVYPMTPEIALRVGMAVAHVFCREGHRGKIIVGKDTRLSGYMFEQAFAAGVCSMGANVYLCGPLPTPGIAFLTSSMRADAGVMISASHNPYYDNGIKIFASDGFKLPDDVEKKLEQLVLNTEMDKKRPSGNEIGKAARITDAGGRYIVFLKNTFPKQRTLEGLKIVVDSGHGAAHRIAPVVFQELGATVYTLGNSPNGQNINHECGALYPQEMSKKVKELGADLGVALDGDADRVVFCDEKGEIIPGEAIMGLCAKRFIERGELNKKTLVTTVMSNMGLDLYLKKLGGCVVRTNVGDRYVMDQMREHGYNLGGETSGHLIFMDHVTTGDGIAGALQVLALMLEENRSLSTLKSEVSLFPQVLINIPIKRKIPLEEIPGLSSRKKQIEEKLLNEGRVLIRYSGTQPEVRVMVEGPIYQEVSGYAEELSILVKNCVG